MDLVLQLNSWKLWGKSSNCFFDYQKCIKFFSKTSWMPSWSALAGPLMVLLHSDILQVGWNWKVIKNNLYCTAGECLRTLH